MANTWTTLLDAVYPVGAVYISWSTTSPAILFGGTWTDIASSKNVYPCFVETSSSSGNYEGQNDITLELAHNHTMHLSWGDGVVKGAGGFYSGSGLKYGEGDASIPYSAIFTGKSNEFPSKDTDKAISPTLNLTTVGKAKAPLGNVTHTNEPFHYTMYAWRRTA